jgi:hypothetical protein
MPIYAVALQLGPSTAFHSAEGRTSRRYQLPNTTKIAKYPLNPLLSYFCRELLSNLIFTSRALP